MTTIGDIQEPIKDHLKAFEKTFRASMKSSVPLLDIITRYILRRKGKQMRPMFVLLTSQLCGGINESTYRAASLIELLHTATLVHDDVVDNSDIRRGLFSINALWKNKIAVLVGDYLLSKGLLLALDHGEYTLLKIVSDATRDMSEGELLQIEKARRLDITEEVYFEIVKKKTASLISACCATGAAAAQAGSDAINVMRSFGEYVGIAFQIKDDLFDFDNRNHTGKPNGLDIREKKLTLPLIHMLNEKDYLEKRRIIYNIKHHRNNPVKIHQIIEEVNKSGGIDYAHRIMMDYREKAFEILRTFPECDSRRSLERLVNFTIERYH
jgi:octaprenyl-diphosphate synthase